MKKLIDIFVSAVMAGFMIGLGGIAYLMNPSPLGAFLFAIGLFVILNYGLCLFTGRVGYTVVIKLSSLLPCIFQLCIIWIGNFIGTYLVSFMIRNLMPQTKINSLISKATLMCNTKLSYPNISAICLGVFCGLLMFLAVDFYSRYEDKWLPKIFSVFLCVGIFILCGFEHCIADMFYFNLAGCMDIKGITFILYVTLGNALGSFIVPLYFRLKAYLLPDIDLLKFKFKG